MDLRAEALTTRQIQAFEVPETASTASNQRHPDKNKLRERIFQLREEGHSMREIAKEVELHWTRVQQILKGK